MITKSYSGGPFDFDHPGPSARGLSLDACQEATVTTAQKRIAAICDEAKIMAGFRLLTAALLVLLLASCTTGSYLGARQSSITTNACAITTKQCFFSRTNLDNNGQKTEIRGFYSLQNTIAGDLVLSGSVKFEHEHPGIKNLNFLDLTFVLFKDGIVAHEETVRVKGREGSYLEFSRPIESDLQFEASEWVWFNWRADTREAL